MNKNPERPEEINDIMFEVFGTGKKKKKNILLPHKQIEKEISAMVREFNER